MKFSTQQLSSGKWGIYSDARLLATVTNQETCEIILSNLSNGQKEVPAGDSSALYQRPERRTPSRHHATKRGEREGYQLLRPSNPKMLNPKMLKTQRSGTALAEFQNRHAVVSEEAAIAYRTWLKQKASHA